MTWWIVCKSTHTLRNLLLLKAEQIREKLNIIIFTFVNNAAGWADESIVIVTSMFHSQTHQKCAVDGVMEIANYKTRKYEQVTNSEKIWMAPFSLLISPAICTKENVYFIFWRGLWS